MWSFIGSQQATNLASLVLVLVTGAYVYLTYRIAAANSQMAQVILRQQDELNRPIIVANIEIRFQVVFVLLIRNAGKILAENLIMKIDRDFFRFGEKKDSHNLRNIAALSGSPFSLASNDALRFDLAQGFLIFANEADPSILPRTFAISAEYTALGKSYRQLLTIDLNPYRMTSWPKSEVVEAIDRIAAAIKNS